MKIAQLVPAGGELSLDRVMANVRAAAQVRLAPFSPDILAFVEHLSRTLFSDGQARSYPELQSLAFWMRRAEMQRLAREFAGIQSSEALVVPRGLVLHFPPSNVDTIFMYSWILSMVTGNANVMRLSARSAGPADVLVRIVNEALVTAPDEVRQGICILRYERDAAVTEALSAECDVRVIWGGDRSVAAIRQIALPPHATELAFPDRSSIAAIRTEVWLSAPEDVTRAAARGFYNDTWWFDQMACSSPRVLVWCGGGREEQEEARRTFFKYLQDEIATAGYTLNAGARMNRLTFACRAILDEPVRRLQMFGPECVVLEVPELRRLARDHCGGGLLFECHVPSLAALSPLVERKNQTLSHFGFGEAELHSFVHAVNGRGIDRIVPFGRALTFSRFWDGYDLLRSFTRVVTVAA